MAHWRDGGIGNLPGSDDRPVRQFTVLEKMAVLLAGQSRGTSLFDEHLVMEQAFDEILRLHAEVDRLKAELQLRSAEMDKNGGAA